jgi:phosphohistidine phosphatase
MKTLFLVRHADAKKGLQVNDIDRPLSRKGYAQAYSIAKELASEKIVKPLFVTSTSVRTMSTAGIFADILNYPRTAIVLDGALYDTSYEEYVDCIIHTDDKYETLFLFGHNPVYNEIVHLIGKEPYVDLMPCTTVLIKLETDHWHHIITASVQECRVFSPK